METSKTNQVETIACNICLDEIPNTVNQNAEADEYVSNYCGLECYQQWRDKHADTDVTTD